MIKRLLPLSLTSHLCLTVSKCPQTYFGISVLQFIRADIYDDWSAIWTFWLILAYSMKHSVKMIVVSHQCGCHFQLCGVRTLISRFLLPTCRWSWTNWPSSTNSTSVFSTPTSSWRSRSAGTSCGSLSASPSGTAPRSTTTFPSFEPPLPPSQPRLLLPIIILSFSLMSWAVSPVPPQC